MTRLEKEEVKLVLEYDISRNFRLDVETDSEEFITESGLESLSEDSDFIDYLNDLLLDSKIQSGRQFFRFNNEGKTAWKKWFGQLT